MHKLEKWNTEDTDWTGLNGFYRVPTRYVTAIKLRNTLVPKLQLGNPDDEALGNCSCVALPPASMQS